MADNIVPFISREGIRERRILLNFLLSHGLSIDPEKKFEPVTFFLDPRTVRILLKDCSFYEDGFGSAITLLRANHSHGEVIGFDIYLPLLRELGN